MFVPDAKRIKLFLIFLLVDLLKDILETAIVTLQDGVLGAQVEGPLFDQRILEATVSEANDRLKTNRKTCGK